MECACSVLDLILIYLVLHVKDMSFDKQGASDVTDQQRKTRNRFRTTSVTCALRRYIKMQFFLHGQEVYLNFHHFCG